MKTKKQVEEAYRDCALSTKEIELWDGEPDLYICQGWQEALIWVLGHRKIKGYRPYKPKKVQ